MASKRKSPKPPAAEPPEARFAVLLEDVQSQLKGFAEGVVGLGERFDRFETRFDAFETRFDAFEARVDARFDRVEARLDRVETDVGVLKTDMALVKVAIVDNTKSIRLL